MISKKEKLDLISEKISQCNLCPILVENRLKTVPGQGDCDTRLVILGEGPGENESKTGIAFCGKSGELLDGILQAAGLHRDKTYIRELPCP